MEKPAVKVDNVSVMFNLNKEQIDNIKEYFIKLLKRQLHFNEFWALQEVSFTIEKGERLGVLGLNGAGKSTLLKVVAGVLKPSMGTVMVDGVIAPLLELGAGFDQNYSGKENIFLYGATMGYSRKYIQEKYDEILDFSELHDFIDVPVKNYSSGMRARLGFSIATAVNPEVLIVDEVLSVGDAKFRKKSEAKIVSMFEKGITVLFVSHNTDQVRRLCNKAILLDKGKVIASGTANEVCDIYDEKVNGRNKSN
ncbi:MAG: ABC transporter ATP-binding protein [Clostridiales bacterium]|jgi:ABC-2 type transport system ATP-binding protein|nr:ABC transporter ATP-binding protein [Clostridiales bacterium]